MSRRLRSFVLTVLGLTLANTARAAATYPSGFYEELVTTLPSPPSTMAFAPDGRIFVCLQSGSLRVVKNGVLLPTPFLTVTVDNTGERGLLGVAFDPQFTTNRYLYIYYTVPGSNECPNPPTTPAHNRIARYRADAMNPDVAESGSATTILEIDNLSCGVNHNGGALRFGLDSKLYVAVGENAVNPSNAQNLNNLLGKILRINADGSVPVDNPYYNQPPKRGEIFLHGVRNPFTFAIHPTNGTMLINDVGANAYEEIDLGQRGKNYGWPICEGPCAMPNPLYTDPVYSYPHISYCGRPAGGAAIIGAAFYTASAYPTAYADAFFFGDLVQQFIKYLDTGNVVHDFACGVDTMVALELGPDGNLYYAARPQTGTSSITRIRYTSGGNRPPTAVATASPLAGPTPLDVTFDASSSTDPDGDTLTYSWDFGDGAMGSGVAPMHTYAVAATRTVTLTVNDGKMQPNSTATATLTVVPGDHPPVPAILTPAMGTTYDALQTISYSGSATDADESLGPGAFSWTIVFHHNVHTHPFLGPIVGTTSGMFQIPNVGEPATDTYYRIHLAVTDSQGVTVETTRDVTPNLVSLTLQTTPANLMVTLDGQPVATPYTFSSVVNFQRTLGPVNPQTVMSTCYELASWSDAGASTHAIAAPMSPATYTAAYTANGAPPSVTPPADAIATQTLCSP